MANAAKTAAREIEYEIKSGKEITRTPIGIEDGHDAPFTYACHEVFAVHSSGERVFMCAFFGGGSLHAAQMYMDYFLTK